VVRFNLSPVLTLCQFDGLSEGIAGFLINFRVRVPLIESGSSTLYLSADVACNSWLLVGVRTVTFGTMSSMPLLMKPVTDVPSEESWNKFQYVLAKQSCSLASASSDHFLIDRVTGASCFRFCLYAGIRRIELLSDLPNGRRGRALYASLCAVKVV
jgi:hypothetical protein